jgi:hypothetical protein
MNTLALRAFFSPPEFPSRKAVLPLQVSDSDLDDVHACVPLETPHLGTVPTGCITGSFNLWEEGCREMSHPCDISATGDENP